MTEANKKQYIADVKVMNYLLQAILNDIYNSVDACKNAKEMWERIRRFMFGFDVTNHVRHLRLMDEFDKFAAKEGESLESVYKRLKTLVNIMDSNNVRPILLSINTKFLNCLQHEWSKYVTIICHNQTGETVSYDQLYDSLVQFEPHVQASKAKRATMNHDLLALITHSNASSSQFMNAGDRTGIKHLMQEVDQLRIMTVITLFSVFHELSQIRERRIEQMLLTMKDEARSNLNDEENDFMLDNSFGDKTLEELTIAVKILEPLSKMTEANTKQCIADVKVINYLLQAIPNDIHNSVDALQFEPRVQASKAKRADRNHDPLALIAHSNASSSQSHANPSYSQLSQSYYVTHPSSFVDYEEDYQGELQGDSQ
ncbi:hypothetical protein Tco_1231746 [Tanacetum coccineum]